MKESLKTKRGITLIALIITIIILLILAMVTINILINQGIIGHANNAVRGYEVAEEKELISLAYQNYKMDKVNKDDAQLTVDGANGGNPIAKEDGTWYITFDKTKHNYELSEDGTVSPAGERWVKDGDTIKKGDYTLKIGDYVAYDHTKDANGNTLTTEYTSYSKANASADKNNGRSNGSNTDYTYNVSKYSGGWRVLGVNNGQVRLISAAAAGAITLQGQEGYQYGVDELNSIGAIYGRGKGATEGRSICIEDINKIMGYSPKKTGDGEIYNKNQCDEYKNLVTYYWKGDDKPYYESTNGNAGEANNTHYSFYYYNGNDWSRQEWSRTANNTKEGREKIVTLKSTYYSYYPNSLTKTSSTNGSPKGIATDRERNVLYSVEGYWLSSSSIHCTDKGVIFGIGSVKYGMQGIDYLTMYMSGGSGAGYGLRIRPVVTLSSNAVITKDADHDGSTQDKACTLTVE